MIKVGLVTSWEDKCGISEYGRHLFDYVQNYVNTHFGDDTVSVTVVALPIGQYVQMLDYYDVIHLNYCGFTMQGWTDAIVREVHRHGKKITLTWHDSNPINNKNDFTLLFDRVVVHEPNTTDGFTYIPQGAPVWSHKGSGEPGWNIGTNGIPQERKNLVELADACSLLNMSLELYAPATHHADVGQLSMRLHNVYPGGVHVHREWLSDDEVLKGLSECRMICYPYMEWNQGPSAATMFGVATGRPIVVSRASQFSHLFAYPDQFYFIESTHPFAKDIADMLRIVHNDILDGKAKLPTKFYEASRWDHCAKRYIDMWKNVAKGW